MRATGTAFCHGWPSAKWSSQQRPGPWGRCASGAGHGHCVSSRLAFGQMLLTAAPPALGGGCVSGAGHGHCVSSRLAFGQMLLKASPRPLGVGALRLRATGTAFRHGWPAAKYSAKQRSGPWGRACCGSGPRALRYVTVGLRPNVPQSSTPGPWGGCASGTGHGHCISSRLAFGQMLLKAAPRPLGAGALRVRATGAVFRHGWPAAKCSSKQRPRPAARGSASEFSTKNTPNVENPRKE